MKILNKVTVTGAGDGINPKDLWRIAECYPFVEFGILLSSKVSLGNGSERFPSKAWLKSLSQEAKKHSVHLNLSGHLCGAWMAGFLTGHDLDFDSYIADGLGALFQRFQINTHAEYYVHDAGLYDLLNSITQIVIFQLDGNCGHRIAKETIDLGHKNIAGLFDLSHGAGVLPDEWPKPIEGLVCGYAGGLSPNNVAEQLSKIEKSCNGITWIDAESSLFQSGKFCLDKVVNFLEESKPWVL